jgi:hypothetical protein
MTTSPCPICGKRFKRLDRHLARHTGAGTTAATLKALRESPPPGVHLHECAAPGACLLPLDLGTDPRSLRDAEARGEPAKLEGGLDLVFGSVEAAESAWRVHREELAGRGRADHRPLALDVFEGPESPWPPAAESEPA